MTSPRAPHPPPRRPAGNPPVRETPVGEIQAGPLAPGADPPLWTGPARHPGIHAAARPSRLAVVTVAADPVGASSLISYRQLEARSCQIARVLRHAGLGPGRRLLLMVGNDPMALAVIWAAQRSGLRYTPLSTGAASAEAAYILADSRADAVVASAPAAAMLDARPPDGEAGAVRIPAHCFVLGAPPSARWIDLLAAADDETETPPYDECEGDALFYSSGTTGRPKGVKRPLTLAPLGHGPDGASVFLDRIGLDTDAVLLIAGPLHHSAGLSWALGALRRAATVVVLESFEPLSALRALEDHRVTHSQWVPTMFVRMLAATRDGYERHRLSHHRAAVHGAGPCPVEVKRQMLEWWGPILWEYYSCTEGIGATLIGPEQWLRRPGSVGKAVLGNVVVRGSDSSPLPAGKTGEIWFSDGYGYSYENDPKKTSAARNAFGEATVGDLGYVDDEGYLYLTGRKAHTVVSGGVNLYPHEIEECITQHGDVDDVAVVGLPDDELGERLVAVVAAQKAGADLVEAVLAHCRARLSRHKVPREVLVVDELPRDGVGKLPRSRLTELVETLRRARSLENT